MEDKNTGEPEFNEEFFKNLKICNSSFGDEKSYKISKEKSECFALLCGGLVSVAIIGLPIFLTCGDLGLALTLSSAGTVVAAIGGAGLMVNKIKEKKLKK